MRVYPEKVLDEFVKMMKDKLNDSIYQINVKHNDGLIIADINDVVIKGCEKGSRFLPYICVSIENGTFTEKDRIIEASIYNLKLEINITRQKELYKHYSRYAEAICDVISNNTVGESWQFLEMVELNGEKVLVRAEC